jgi:Spy/CpxP family protein refolding chaperone
MRQQMELDRIDMIFKIKAILTPEQFQKLQVLHAERAKSRGKMKGHHQAAGERGEGRGE